MKSFVHALKLIGVYFLMYCVFVALSALVVPLEKLQGLAAWMVCQMFIKLLEMKNASDKAEDQAAARRRQEEGNSFIMSDGNGGTLTMNRIGNTDDFACSDGHTYTRSGGSSGYYGDYEKRY